MEWLHCYVHQDYADQLKTEQFTLKQPFVHSLICMGETSESSKQGKSGQGPGANEAPMRCR